MFKWLAFLSALAGLTTIVGITQVKSTPTKIEPALTVGSRAHVPVDSALDSTLQSNGVKFVATIPRSNPRVSAARALTFGNNVAHLTRKPIKSTVEYVLFTDPGQRIKDKPAWKVTYLGAPVMLNGPDRDRKSKSAKFDQPSSKRAVTYVIRSRL